MVCFDNNNRRHLWAERHSIGENAIRLFARKLIQFPRRCLFCGGPAGRASWCAACHADLPWNDRACERCGIRLTTAGDTICGRCLSTPPPFDSAVCAFRYQFPIDRLVVKLKFHSRLGHAQALGLLLAARIEQRHAELPEAILPVPLHPRRLRERGFNQATEIARVVGSRFDLPVLTSVCARRINTTAQSALAANARRRNVHSAFFLQRPVPVNRVAIVDDVITTGATAGELARTLIAAGTRPPAVWSPARA